MACADGLPGSQRCMRPRRRCARRGVQRAEPRRLLQPTPWGHPGPPAAPRRRKAWPRTCRRTSLVWRRNSRRARGRASRKDHAWRGGPRRTRRRLSRRNPRWRTGLRGPARWPRRARPRRADARLALHFLQRRPHLRRLCAHQPAQGSRPPARECLAGHLSLQRRRPLRQRMARALRGAAGRRPRLGSPRQAQGARRMVPSRSGQRQARRARLVRRGATSRGGCWQHSSWRLSQIARLCRPRSAPLHSSRRSAR